MAFEVVLFNNNVLFTKFIELLQFSLSFQAKKRIISEILSGTERKVARL